MLGNATVPVGGAGTLASPGYIQLPSLQVRVWSGTSLLPGTPVSGAKVTARDTGCNVTRTLTPRAGTDALGQVPQAPPSGGDIGLPYGTLRRLRQQRGGHRQANRHRGRPDLGRSDRHDPGRLSRQPAGRDVPMRDERGSTIVELLVTISASLVVMMAVVTLTTAVLHHQDRINRRVDANSRARPVMTRIVQELHSACVTSHIVPIQAGSTGTSMTFLSKSGSAVRPTPDLHTISLNGTTLRESVYPATGGTAPSWTFSGTPSSNVSCSPTSRRPAAAVPLLRLRQRRALRHPAADAAERHRTPPGSPTSPISFTSSPTGGRLDSDPGSPLMLSDSVDLRLESAGQFPNQDNLPCI